MKKILIVLEAGDALPSGVIRGLIYKDLFAPNGYAARYISRIPPFFVRLFQSSGPLFSNNRKKCGYLKECLNALYLFLDQRIVNAAKGCDVVYLSKVRSHKLIRRLKKKTHARLVYDFGDAIWLPGRISNQLFDVEKFEEILRSVNAVTTDNEHTAVYARRFNAEVVPIPDYPQIEQFDRERRAHVPRTDSSKVVIGWVGSPSTAYNLYVIWEALEAVFSKHKNIELRLVGTGLDMRLLPQFENVKYSIVPFYSQKEMVREILAMDIGLFPLQDTEASLVRGILKATVYMSGGCVVIGSSVGQCKTFIRDGVNGFLAKDTDEWIRKLDRLITDPSLRGRVAEAGLQTVREKFSLQDCFGRLLKVLNGAPQ